MLNVYGNQRFRNSTILEVLNLQSMAFKNNSDNQNISKYLVISGIV